MTRARSFSSGRHISTALALALRRRGIDVTTTSDANLIGALDREHLSYSTGAGRVVVTQDADFLQLHAEGVPHAGIVYCQVQSRSLSEMVRRLVLIHQVFSDEDLKNRVEYL